MNEGKRVESKFWEMVIGRRIGDASEKKKNGWGSRFVQMRVYEIKARKERGLGSRFSLGTWNLVGNAGIGKLGVGA